MKYEVIGTLMDESSQVPMAKEIVPVSIPIHNYKILTMLLPPEILIIFEKNFPPTMCFPNLYWDNVLLSVTNRKLEFLIFLLV